MIFEFIFCLSLGFITLIFIWMLMTFDVIETLIDSVYNWNLKHLEDVDDFLKKKYKDKDCDYRQYNEEFYERFKKHQFQLGYDFTDVFYIAFHSLNHFKTPKKMIETDPRFTKYMKAVRLYEQNNKG